MQPSDLRIRFGQSSRSVLARIRVMITAMGMKTGRVCGPYISKEEALPYYELFIYGIDEVRRFFKKVGSEHPDKRSLLLSLSSMNPV